MDDVIEYGAESAGAGQDADATGALTSVVALGAPELERLALSGRPYGLAADPGRRAVWVTLTDTNRLVGLRVTRDGLRPFANLPTVRQPNSVALDVASGRVDVAGSASGVRRNVH